MKITAPVKSKEYVKKIIEAGAGEIFGGVVDDEWLANYGNYIEFNRRGSYGLAANCRSYEEIGEIIRIAENYGVEFDLTINALQFWHQQYSCLEHILDQYIQVGGKNVIISDMSIIPILKDRGLKIIVSSCANVHNQYIASYFKDAGCKKIIFPRDIRISEMQEIIHQIPSMEYEMFMMNSGCRFQDGHCLGLHNTKFKELCSFCGKDAWKYYRKDGAALSTTERELVCKNEEDYRRLFKHACGQCMLYPMRELVDSVKVLERKGSEEYLIRLIELTAENIQIADDSETYPEFLRRMKRPEQADCRDHYSCYYRSDMFSLKFLLNSFMAENDLDHKLNDIDFLGVNLSASKQKPYMFKLYYKGSHEEQGETELRHPRITALAKKNMIRNITRIERSASEKQIHFDLNLCNRDNANMEYFLQLINGFGEERSEEIELVRKLAALKINEDPDQQYAALYYYGLWTNESKEITAEKFHFLTRKCDDTDRIFEGYHYDDAYFLHELEQIPCSELQKCSEIVRAAVELQYAHLWMIGYDLFHEENGGRQGKYKIYIKEVKDHILQMLADHLEGHGDNASIITRLREADALFSEPCSVSIYGIGICFESGKGYSFNLYLKPRS